MKAAALGKLYECKKLIEAGVDPLHVDPYGNTAREKALLYFHSDLADYLLEQEKNVKSGQL